MQCARKGMNLLHYTIQKVNLWEWLSEEGIKGLTKQAHVERLKGGGNTC